MTPASPAQAPLWLLQQLEPNSTAYNVAFHLDLDGPLDAAALERAWRALVERHDALRSTFLPGEDGPQLVTQPADATPLVTVTCSSEEAAAHHQAQVALPFELSERPAVRAHLYRVAAERHTLGFVLHHAVFDGWSLAPFLAELATAYDAALDGRPPSWPPLPVQYADFTRWQWQRLKGEILERQLAYWRERLDGAPCELELPTDRPRPPVQDLAGRTLPVRFPRDLATGLEALARDARATPFMTLWVAFAVLLSRLTGRRDLIVGTPVAGRDRERFEGLLGLFVNTLPLRLTLPRGVGFRGLLETAREVLLEDFAHQELPFERLVEELQPARDLSREPLFQVMVSLQRGGGEGVRMRGLETELESVPSVTARLELSLVFRLAGGLGGEPGGELEASVEYRTALFDTTSVERWMRQLGRILEAVVADPAAPVDGIELLGAPERHQLVTEWSRSLTVPDPAPRAVHLRVHERAVLRPSAPALEHGEVVWSYEDLVSGAGRMASGLRRRGVGRGSLVGVLADRSPAEVALLLAILDRGSAFLLLDAEWPAARLRFVLEDAAPNLVVVSPGRAVPAVSGVEVVGLEALLEETAGERGEPAAEVEPGDLAYVVYTSGSTGRPKGVAVTHGGLANLLAWHGRAFPVSAGHRATRLSGPAFDAAVWELWPALVGGGAVAIPTSEAVRRSPPELQRWLFEQRVTSCFAATPMAEALLALAWPPDVALERLHTAGDRLTRRPPPGLPFAVFNHYGPTETTIEATWCPVAPEGFEPGAPAIGRSIDGAFAAVVDEAGAPVPVGVAGELLVGGTGLARGYLR
ncbi:MAG: AMP-binding protein, partial [Acidobacteria bacterium]|nr:AMP-binding protein [Acidobacteriota bacterium]